MITLPDNISDETLEWVAREIEVSFPDFAGVMAPRKRGREDADLRRRSRFEMRREIVQWIRAMMNRPELSAVSVLSTLAARAGSGTDAFALSDAWPLAWKGWLDITAQLHCASNSVPPQIEYRITLTERGREVLARAGARADG